MPRKRPSVTLTKRSHWWSIFSPTTRILFTIAAVAFCVSYLDNWNEIGNAASVISLLGVLITHNSNAILNYFREKRKNRVHHWLNIGQSSRQIVYEKECKKLLKLCKKLKKRVNNLFPSLDAPVHLQKKLFFGKKLNPTSVDEIVCEIEQQYQQSKHMFLPHIGETINMIHLRITDLSDYYSQDRENQISTERQKIQLEVQFLLGTLKELMDYLSKGALGDHNVTVE